MEAIYEEYKKRQQEVQNLYKYQNDTGQSRAQHIEAITANNTHYLFGALVDGGFYEEAKKYVKTYISLFMRKDDIYGRWGTNINAVIMLNKNGVAPMYPLQCCTNLENTKRMSNEGLLDNCHANQVLVLDDYESVKFILETHKKLVAFPYSNSGHRFVSKITNVKIFKLALEHFGEVVIYDHNGNNMYINNKEFMDVIQNYKYTVLDICQINDLHALIRLRLKGYKIVNDIWTAACKNGETTLFDENDNSIIWRSAVHKKILEESKDDDVCKNNVLCYYLDQVEDPEDTLEYMELVSNAINLLVYKQYALYCLIYKFYEGLRYAITNYNIINRIYRDEINVYSAVKRVAANKKKFKGDCLMSIAIKTMDLRAIELLKNNGADTNIIVNGKDLLQIVFDLPSQVAQQKIITLLS